MLTSLNSSERSLNDDLGQERMTQEPAVRITSLVPFLTSPVSTAKESRIITHVRYIKIPTYSEALGAKLPFFSRLYYLLIPRRDLNTKKTKLNTCKYRKINKTPRSPVRILIYRTDDLWEQVYGIKHAL